MNCLTQTGVNVSPLRKYVVERNRVQCEGDALTTRPWSKIGEVPSVHEVRLMSSVRKHQLQRLWHTGYQGASPAKLLPVTSGKVLEWDPLRSLKLSKIAALVIGWVTAGRNLVGRIGDRPRFPGVAGSNLTGG